MSILVREDLNRIDIISDIEKESASIDMVEMMQPFGIPPEHDRQKDLQYISAILVSSGMNLNGACFLPSELIQARNTINDKPLDIEHLESVVVGHIFDRVFMLKDRSMIDPQMFLLEKGTHVDNENIDVAVAMVLYKYRFPEIAQDVMDGKYKVSMECYYKSFDVKVGDVIVSRNEALALGISTAGRDSLIGKKVKVVAGKKSIGSSVVGRVFRDIMFSGCGLVEYPANPESIILEAASKVDSSSRDTNIVIIDLEKSETYMKDKQEKEKLVLSHASPDEKDSAYLGVVRPASDNPGTCVNFKKYVYEFVPPSESDRSQENQPNIPPVSGIGDNPSLEDKIVHEHWCSLFDSECTVLAGIATDPRCLRNVFNTTVKDMVADMQDLHNQIHSKDEMPAHSSLKSLKSLRVALKKASTVLKGSSGSIV